MKKMYFLCIAFCLGFPVQAQIINFPDAAFKSRLFDYGASKDATQTIIDIDANADGEVSTDEAQDVFYLNVTGISNENLISSLEGIGYFTNLKELRCYGNLIENLDLSGLANLEKVLCQNNRIQSIDLSQTSVVVLNAASNQIDSLSDISFIDQGGFDTLILSYNWLTSIDASGLPQMVSILDFSNNQVAHVDLSGINWLAKLFCANNQLTQIDTSALTFLNYLSCGNNQITTLDVSQNSYLNYLYCRNNPITSLDLSHHPVADFDVRSNSLISLNIENGDYDGDGLYTTIPGSPNLEYVCVDAYEGEIIQNWLTLANVSTNCILTSGCNLSRSEFNADRFSVSPNPATDFLNIHSKSDDVIDSIAIYNVLGALVQTQLNPSETIDVSHLKSGVYLLRIATAKGIANNKFVKK